MSAADTCWTVVRGAAAGDPAQRSLFVRLYAPVIRAYLRARWRGSALLQEVDDAVQETFLDCFRQGGVLDTVDADRPGGFRPFLYAVVRNVARHLETKRRRNREHPAPSGFEPAAGSDDLSTVFDRAWALAVVREALARMRDRREVELLRLRFQEDLPVREIARRWDEDPARVHRAYARARRAYQDALVEVVTFHQPGARGAALKECRRLLSLL